MAVTANSKILASDVSGAIKSITRSGTTFTYTRLDGSTGTFTQQDNNTTYSAATSSALGLVKIGSNITNSSGTISLTKSNVTSALGYTPPTSSGTDQCAQVAYGTEKRNANYNCTLTTTAPTKMTLPSGGTWVVLQGYEDKSPHLVGNKSGRNSVYPEHTR